MTPHLASHKSPFGLKNGRIVVPGEVESGLACSCICPGCGAKLIAKKGDIISWHFAHYNCAMTPYCLESQIHAAAKQILVQEQWLHAPETSVSVSMQTDSGQTVTKTKTLRPVRKIQFDYCEEEQQEGDVRPDVKGFRGGQYMYVEMYFTHKIDKEKQKKLDNLQIPVLEIDLSDLSEAGGFQAVRQRVLHDLENKSWITYPGVRQAKIELQKLVEAEVRRRNDEHATHLARIKSQEEAKSLALDRQLQKIAEEMAANQKLPTVEKESQLRRLLKLKSEWPPHLNKPNISLQAFKEPPHIWQSDLFYQFVYGRQRYVFSARTAYLKTAARIGVLEGKEDDAEKSVQFYLRHLHVLRFLRRDNVEAGARAAYEVLHGALSPLQSLTSLGFEGPAALPQYPKGSFIWRASWPTSEELPVLAAAYAVSKQDEDILAPAVCLLTPKTRPETPWKFVMQMAQLGVEPTRTLKFLRDAGLMLAYISL